MDVRHGCGNMHKSQSWFLHKERLRKPYQIEYRTTCKRFLSYHHPKAAAANNSSLARKPLLTTDNRMICFIWASNVWSCSKIRIIVKVMLSPGSRRPLFGRKLLEDFLDTLHERINTKSNQTAIFNKLAGALSSAHCRPC